MISTNHGNEYAKYQQKIKNQHSELIGGEMPMPLLQYQSQMSPKMESFVKMKRGEEMGINQQSKEWNQYQRRIVHHREGMTSELSSTDWGSSTSAVGDQEKATNWKKEWEEKEQAYANALRDYKDADRELREQTTNSIDRNSKQGNSLLKKNVKINGTSGFVTGGGWFKSLTGGNGGVACAGADNAGDLTVDGVSLQNYGSSINTVPTSLLVGSPMEVGQTCGRDDAGKNVYVSELLSSTLLSAPSTSKYVGCYLSTPSSS